MPELMLLNPIRGKRKTKRKAKATAKRRAVTGAAKRTARRKKTNRTHHIAGYYPNPSKRPSAVKKKHRRRKSARRAHTHTFKKNPITARRHGRKRRHSFRKNPIGGLVPMLTESLAPAALGAGSALLLDVGLGYLPLPATWKTGYMDSIVRIGGAVALGVGASFVTSRKNAEMVTVGALTGTLYDIARGFLKNQFPAIPLSGVNAYPAVTFAPRPMAPVMPTRVNGPAPAYLAGNAAPGYLGDYEDASPMNSGSSPLNAYAY